MQVQYLNCSGKKNIKLEQDYDLILVQYFNQPFVDKNSSDSILSRKSKQKVFVQNLSLNELIWLFLDMKMLFLYM